MIREAARFQNEVADYIGSHKVRPQDSTGRLERVTREPGNRLITPSTWRVGVPSFLNRSEAKYYRLIEFGSAGLYARGRGFRGTPLMLNPTGFTGGRPFRSFKDKRMKNDDYRAKFYSKNPGTGKGRRVVTVKNEIKPMHAYSTVFEANGWRARIRRDFKDSVVKGFLRG